MAEREPHLSETEASAGKKLGTMRYVLAISLVAIVVILAIVLAMINVVGGYAVTDRMLQMFSDKEKK